MNTIISNKTMGNQAVKAAPVVDDTLDSLLQNKNNVTTVGAGQIVDLSTMTEEEALLSDMIEARPTMMSDALDIRIKRSEYAYRWFQFKAADGLRLSQALNSGWTKAYKEDAEPLNTNLLTSDGIVSGDVILLKMRKDQYYGILKNNVITALERGTRSGISSAASLSSAAILKGAPANKINLFVPSQTEIDAKNGVIPVKI